MLPGVAIPPLLGMRTGDAAIVIEHGCERDAALHNQHQQRREAARPVPEAEQGEWRSHLSYCTPTAAERLAMAITGSDQGVDQGVRDLDRKSLILTPERPFRVVFRHL